MASIVHRRRRFFLSKANVQVKTAKTVTAGLVLPTLSLAQVLLLSPTAGLHRALLDPSTRTHTVVQAAVAEIFEAVATAAVAEAATAVVLLAVLETDNGKMASTSLAPRI